MSVKLSPAAAAALANATKDGAVSATASAATASAATASITTSTTSPTPEDDAKRESFLKRATTLFGNIGSLTHTSLPLIKINADYNLCLDVDGLRTTPFQYQRTSIAALVELENNSEIIEGNRRLRYSAGVLSDPFGSGKTIVVIGLISTNRFPKPRPTYMKYHNGHIIKTGTTLLPLTFVFVSRSVLEQWSKAFRKYSSLRVYVINDVYALRKFIAYAESGEIRLFDVVLVKHSVVTVKVTLPVPLDPKNSVTSPYIYCIIENYLRGRRLHAARVVVDDFDTLRLPSTASPMDADFTLYVSSTTPQRRGVVQKHVNSVRGFIDQYPYGCNEIASNPVLFSLLNVQSDKAFVEATNQLPICRFYASTFKHPNDRAVAGLIGIGDELCSKVAEMINGDALMQAAETLGNVSMSIGDIFSRLIGSKMKDYELARDLVEFITEFEPQLADLEDAKIVCPDYAYSRTNLLEFEEPKYKVAGIIPLFRDALVEFKAKRDKLGLIVQRVKDNMKHGECPTCISDFREDERKCVVMRCCGVCICSICVRQAVRLGNNLGGECPNCRSNITFDDMFVVDPHVNLREVVDAPLQDIDLVVPVKVIRDTSAPIATKYSTLIDIIRGVDIKSERVEVALRGMMKGRSIMPPPTIRRVLVFANHAETLKQAEAELVKERIKYFSLIGTVTQLNNVVSSFETHPGDCVLLVNSGVYCAGLNLQFSTHIVYLHDIINEAIRAQIIGRGQRVGRTNNLSVHFLLYKSEYDSMRSAGLVSTYVEDEPIEPAKPAPTKPVKVANHHDDDEVDDIGDDVSDVSDHFDDHGGDANGDGDDDEDANGDAGAGL